MSDRKITISFGGGTNLAAIQSTREMSWSEFAERLVRLPPETDDKAAVGWYCCGKFSPEYRHNSNLQFRDCLTLDYDHVTAEDVKAIRGLLGPYEYTIYTTWSHALEKPRVRVVLPLSRSASPDEFCAVSRRIAEQAGGIELPSRETHVPAQCMFLPSRKPGADFRGLRHAGEWVDVDAILATYADWTDKTQWPHRSDGDSTHHAATAERPDEKEGIVGDFCRAFDVPAAIEKFQLPYTRTADPDRWTYAHGSRPEGAILYDDGAKLHSHHDTDPARGQHNSFDLVRLHKFNALDPEHNAAETAITDLPSFRAMVDFALAQPELRAVQAAAELDDLGPLPERKAPASAAEGAASLARRICDVLKSPTVPRWLLTDKLERGVIAVLAGPRGSYKSFIALDWGMRVAQRGDCVYAVSGEGGDFDRRARAWIDFHSKGDASLPLYVVERRIDLSGKDGIDLIRSDCVRLGIRPALFILDTFSKLSGGLDENDNSEVKQFIGGLDNGLKRAETGFDATVLLIAHTGHSDAGRPRGASALAADTDAEYIVARNPDGSVVVSRERFKSSPELAPLMFRPQIISLGYRDGDGNAVTSLVMEPADVTPSVKKIPDPRTPVQRKALEEAAKELVHGPRPFKEVARAMAARVPKGDGRDQRLSRAQRQLTNLIEAGYLFSRDELISTKEITAATAVSGAEFDKLPERSTHDR